MLRAGVHIKTASWSPTLPFQCVWRQKDGIRCHVGRIFDPLLFQEGSDEYVQNRFPRKKPILLREVGGQMSVTPASESSMSKNKGNGIKTGSVPVYYKQGFGRGSVGDIDVVEVNSDTGYVYWAESRYISRSDSVYVILKRSSDGENTTKWIMSLVDADEVQKDDIKIACVSGSSCVQLWQSDIVYVSSAAETDHPFKVTITDVQANYISLNIRSGLVNNVLMSDMQLQYTGDLNSGLFVYLKCAGSNNAAFPSSVVADVGTSVPADTDSYGYVAVATISGTLIQQQVYTSLWGERHKYTAPNATRYFYYRI